MKTGLGVITGFLFYLRRRQFVRGQCHHLPLPLLSDGHLSLSICLPTSVHLPVCLTGCIFSFPWKSATTLDFLEEPLFHISPFLLNIDSQILGLALGPIFLQGEDKNKTRF